MKKAKFSYNENAKVSYKVSDVITACLTGLESFLKGLKENNPDSLITIVNYLNSKYSNEEDFGVSIDTDYQILQQYPELLKGSINAALSLVNYRKNKQESIDEEAEIDVIDLVRTFNHFEYSFMISLLEIMSHKEAIDYIKRMADDIIHSRKDPSRYLETLEGIIERFRVNAERWQTQDVVAEVLDDKKLLYKVKKCRWAEVMKDFDPELSYAIMCYTDFENAKNLNPNFILKRTKTKMMEDEYCDFCYHDTRKEKEIAHPSEKEFQELD
ncbi:MAG: L-2-amino-thiazoline-4-carboxylic acid hydrolase [Candidatus Lokiarchaeia archaeon]